jgi:formylglycine-generating enzyme required for sulfatase activity
VADIFISYAKADRSQSERLAQYLTSQGYTVWWDASLLSGENFRDVIMRELAAAQFVIVIWSQASINSPWVLSEAEHARIQNKLFPIRVRALNPNLIPLPFSILHTQLVDERAKILAALASVQTQTSPEFPPNAPHSNLSPTRRTTGQFPPDEPLEDHTVGPHSLAGTEFRDTPDSPLMVIVPGGGFIMGSPVNEVGRAKTEGPAHRVRIAEAFAVGKYPVTFKEWDVFCELTHSAYRPSDNGWGRGEMPVVNVSREDCDAYCAWLANVTGHRYRLLTEAEWEYCCRSGTVTRFFFGDTISTEQANFNGSAHPLPGSANLLRRRTTPVGQFAPNGFGLTDMHGNVSEWVQDPWHDDYHQAPTDGRSRNGIASRCVLRGGSWFDYPQHVRSAHRAWAVPSERAKNIGVRVCRSLSQPR